MRTPATELVGIDMPIFAFSHCRDVVAAVSKAGGLGVLGAVAHSPEQLDVDLAWIEQEVKGKPFGPAVKIALLKSLKRARYFTEPLGHYGLSKSDYTHFTSPIRRYSDLIVHRALERRLGLSKIGPDSSSLGALAEHISTTERTAADAEKESVRLKKLEFFQIQAASENRQAFLM